MSTSRNMVVESALTAVGHIDHILASQAPIATARHASPSPASDLRRAS